MASSKWNIHVMNVYKENKKNNPNYKFKDAMKDAKKTYKNANPETSTKTKTKKTKSKKNKSNKNKSKKNKSKK
jgi:hypothetical protein